jgi:hypothetical protein
VVPKEFFVNRLRREPNGNIVKWWELYYKLVVTIQSGANALQHQSSWQAVWSCCG